jgi:dTDP-4-dehydrorhamnose reductase
MVASNEAADGTSAPAVPLSGFLGARGEPVAILGGDGLLATALADLLARCHVPHAVLPRKQCDLGRSADLVWLLRDLAPACVINCAAITDCYYCERHAQIASEVNGIAVGRLAAMCRAQAVPLVHFSCASVFDGNAVRPYRTDDSATPLCQYGRSKVLGERLLQRFAPQRWLLIRTSWLFGQISRDFVGRLLSSAQRTEPIQVIDDEVGSPTFAADLARAVLLLLVAGETGIWHLSNRGTATWYTFAKAVVRTWARPTLVCPWPGEQCESEPPNVASPAPRRTRSNVLDCSTTYRKLGLRMRMWESALQAYYRRVKQASEPVADQSSI